jgi:hypothetical protein
VKYTLSDLMQLGLYSDAAVRCVYSHLTVSSGVATKEKGNPLGQE